jgi:hypothetical protein
VCVCKATVARHKEEEEVYLSKLMFIFLLPKKNRMGLCRMTVVHRFTQNVCVCVIYGKREKEKRKERDI